MDIRHCAALLCLGFTCIVSAADGPEGARDQLQQLGRQLESAQARVAAGEALSSYDLALLQERTRELAPAAGTSNELATKYRALKLRLAQLQRPGAYSRPASSARTVIDAEAVTTSRGGECAHALGLSRDLPVSLTLAAHAAAGSSAWLRIAPLASETLRVSASSASTDPQLEVFSSCSAAQPAVRNDDTIGLDSALSLDAQAAQPFFVHVLNRGAGGSVMVQVQGGNGSVTGTVRDSSSGDPIASAYVDLYATNGAIVATTNTAPDGTYTIAQSPGDYYVVSQSATYATQIYAGVDCAPGYDMIGGCDPGNASVVHLDLGGTVAGVDFALDHGHSLQGQIRDSANHPLSGYVVLYNAAGFSRESYSTDEFGRFKISTLPPGTYKVAAQVNGFDAQMYDHRGCGVASIAQCDLADATAIALADLDLAGIDFAMLPSAAISGRVLLPNGQPAAAQVIAVPDPPLQYGGSAFAAADGSYRIGPLQTGSYRVYAAPGAGYYPMVYPAIDCSTFDCRYEIPGGTNIQISQPGVQMTADLRLHAIAPVAGHVSDTMSGAPLAGVEIHANSTFGFYVFPIVAVTDADGNFSTNAFSVGDYYLWARSVDHVDQLYNGIDCEADGYLPAVFPCNIGTATTISIAPGPTPTVIDFQLRASGAVSGAVMFDAGPGSHTPATASIVLYDSSGNVQAGAQPDVTGKYVLNDIPPGDYRAVAQFNNSDPFVDQIWPALNCARPCDPTAGQAIQVAAGMTTSGIDFRVMRSDAVVGRVTDATNAPIVGALVDLFLAADGSYFTSAQSDDGGYYVALAPYAAYLVATEAGHGFIDQAYQDVACPLGAAYYGLCPLAGATAIGLSPSSLQPTIVDFALQRTDPIFTDGFE